MCFPSSTFLYADGLSGADRADDAHGLSSHLGCVPQLLFLCRSLPVLHLMVNTRIDALTEYLLWQPRELVSGAGIDL